MAQYTFTISDGDPFTPEDVRDDTHAWKEAIRTVRDVESSLPAGGGTWSLVVARDGRPIYRIEVLAQKLD